MDAGADMSLHVVDDIATILVVKHPTTGTGIPDRIDDNNREVGYGGVGGEKGVPMPTYDIGPSSIPSSYAPLFTNNDMGPGVVDGFTLSQTSIIYPMTLGTEHLFVFELFGRNESGADCYIHINDTDGVLTTTSRIGPIFVPSGSNYSYTPERGISFSIEARFQASTSRAAIVVPGGRVSMVLAYRKLFEV